MKEEAYYELNIIEPGHIFEIVCSYYDEGLFGSKKPNIYYVTWKDGAVSKIIQDDKRKTNRGRSFDKLCNYIAERLEDNNHPLSNFSEFSVIDALKIMNDINDFLHHKIIMRDLPI